MGGNYLYKQLSSVGFFVGVVFGGGGRVRTRNTLHIVGARKSLICYDAVERRKKEKREKR